MKMKLAGTDKNIDIGSGVSKTPAPRRMPSGFPVRRLSASSGERIPGFTGTISMPRPEEATARLYLRMIRAAELAEWEATGGDVLRSETTD